MGKNKKIPWTKMVAVRERIQKENPARVKLSICPGSCAAANEAIQFFGKDRVDAGNFTSPVFIHGLTDEEAIFAKEFFGEVFPKSVVTEIFSP